MRTKTRAIGAINNQAIDDLDSSARAVDFFEGPLRLRLLRSRPVKSLTTLQ